MKLPLRRTLVQQYNYEPKTPIHKVFVERTLFLFAILLRILRFAAQSQKVQECDATGDAMKYFCLAHNFWRTKKEQRITNALSQNQP